MAEDGEPLATWFLAVEVFPEADFGAVDAPDLWVDFWAVWDEEWLVFVCLDEVWRDLLCRDGVLITASCLGETGR